MENRLSLGTFCSERELAIASLSHALLADLLSGTKLKHKKGLEELDKQGRVQNAKAGWGHQNILLRPLDTPGVTLAAGLYLMQQATAF